MAQHPPIDPRRVSTASVAVFAAFALAGFNFSTWAARLPAVRDGLGLSANQMGLLLLVGSFGSLVALPLSGLVVTRIGAPRAVLGFAVLNALGLATAAFGASIGEVVVTGAGLVVFGVGTGVWDAAMNLEGAVVEQKLGRTVMPRYHAGFSVGTVVAAGIAALAARADVPVQVHVGTAVACRRSRSRSRCGSSCRPGTTSSPGPTPRTAPGGPRCSAPGWSPARC